MNYFLLILSCLFLSSCTNSYKNMIILPSDSLVAECTIAPPPFLTGNTEKDKLILAGAWSLQTSNLGKCNQKIKTLQTWKVNTMKRMEGL